VVQVDIGGGKKSMDACAGGPFKGAPGSFNVTRTTTRQGGNYRASNLPRQRPHGVKVPFRCDRKSGFNDVYAQTIELVRHAQLLFAVHAATWRLFSVAQGGVEYGYVFSSRQVILPAAAKRPVDTIMKKLKRPSSDAVDDGP
jgi:hypothetical protein